MPLNSRDVKLTDAGKTLEQRKDIASHFILRLAFCQTEELRRWFINQECFLLKQRFEMLTEAEKQQFFVQNGIEFDLVTDLQDLKPNLMFMGDVDGCRLYKCVKWVLCLF